MELNPVSELKRRLEDDTQPLSKRLCLARNVASTRYLPTSAKEEALGDWLDNVGGEAVESVLEWSLQETGSELLGKLVEVVAKYLQNNRKEVDLTEKIITFLENDKIQSELTTQVKNFLLITRTLLSELRESVVSSRVALCKRLLNIVKHVYRTVPKKVDFITKFLDGETLESVFKYLDDEDLRESCLNVCETVLFPISKKSHYSKFLQTLIRKENMDELLAEKGDNTKSVIKVMSTFFAFPKGRTCKDVEFLNNFIDVFVSSFKTESHLIFMFFIMAINSLNIQQTYLKPAMTMPSITFDGDDDNTKRTIILKALKYLKRNDVDLNVKLTETLGEKLTKVEIKKNFATLLQVTIMSVLKLEGKPDVTSLNIITLALRLDPNLIEPKLDKILPKIMSFKKNNAWISQAYEEMLYCLLETLFKLSRGTEFISRIVPLVKVELEALNTEQFELGQKLQEAEKSIVLSLIGKIISGVDLFPYKCIDKYGRLTAELTLKQNGELFVSLQKELETHCLILLEEGFVSPSLVTLSEVLSGILSSVLAYSKMSDHTVPLHIAQDFWNNFHQFEVLFLSKYGHCLLNLSYHHRLTSSFLKLCLSYGDLKLLNARYGNVKMEGAPISCSKSTDVFDFSMVLRCLSREQWLSVASRSNENKDDNCIDTLNQLLLQKIMLCDLLSSEENKPMTNDYIHKIKLHLMQNTNTFCLMKTCPQYATVLFHKLNQNLEQKLAKDLVKQLKVNTDVTILSNVAITNNKPLLNSVVLDTLKNILKVIEDYEFLKSHKSLRKAMKAGFEIEDIVKDLPLIFNDLSNTSAAKEEENLAKITREVDKLKALQISTLDEESQLLTIFILLAVKNILSNMKLKKLKRNIDEILLEIFEMSQKYPNLFKIFPVEFMFSFENKFLKLLTLSRVKSNRLFVVKAMIESAVKKVRTDSDIVKNIVNILLKKQKFQKESINLFSNEVFKITCMILPVIAKEKKAITTSQYRSILADLQDKLHEFLLKSFENVDLGVETSNFLSRCLSDIDESLAEMSEDSLATLNAIEAYSLTLFKYCVSNDDSKLHCLLKHLDYFVGNAILAIHNSDSKQQHVDASIQLLNVILRNVRTLATHNIFKEKDRLYIEMWQALKSRIFVIFSEEKNKTADSTLDDVGVVIKFMCELCGVDFFTTHVAMDLSNLMMLKAPTVTINTKNTPNSVLTSHRVAKYLWCSVLKANVIGPKSAAMSKSMFRTTKNLILWLRTNFDTRSPVDKTNELADDVIDVPLVAKLNIDDEICELLTCDLEVLTEVIVNAKKITLSHRFLDSIFELHQFIVGVLSEDISLTSFLRIMNAEVASMNCLPLHRNELLEDRWQCYLQIYRGLVSSLCRRADPDQQLDRATEEQLAETAHSFEKLTQAICKQKSQISRLAAYLVADICSSLESTAPSRLVRQHLENCVSLLIQASENTYAMAFLRRALAGNPGQMTMTNLYTMYKRYHKYVGTS